MGRKRKNGGKPESSRKGKPEGDADSGTKETVEETVEYTQATDPPVPEQADVRPPQRVSGVSRWGVRVWYRP